MFPRPLDRNPPYDHEVALTFDMFRCRVTPNASSDPRIGMCEGDPLHGRTNGARLSVDGAARAAREIEEGFASLREAIGDPQAVSPFFRISVAPEVGRAVPRGPWI